MSKAYASAATKKLCGKRKTPRVNARGFTTYCDVRKLLSLTEDTVDLRTADWADALRHATT